MIPITPLLILYLTVFLAGVALETVLTRINVGHLKKYGGKVPETLKEYIDPATLSRIRDYTIKNQNFVIITSFISSSLFIVVILSGLLPWVSRVIQGFGFGALASGMAFFTAIGLGEVLFSLPFSYYQTFVIEQRYGYNTSTLKIWITDILKGLVLGLIIGGILLSSLLSLVEHGGHFWWLWAWFVFFAFQVLLAVIYPTIIAPWFNKFLPLEDKVLEEKVKDIMRRSGLSVTGVFKMDASKRSRHTNAYFAGLGKAKRIVLFDTLLASHSHDEIIAILAHEAGHWKQKHVFKNLVFTGVFSLVLLYLASTLIKWNLLYQLFAFQQVLPYVGLFLVWVLWDALALFLVPIGSAISRRFERKADCYAARQLPQTADLTRALKRLAKDNLSNLHPHPLYAWFYYSHPPLLKRISYLENIPQPCSNPGESYKDNPVIS